LFDFTKIMNQRPARFISSGDHDVDEGGTNGHAISF
jgi:hypothetical protein